MLTDREIRGLKPKDKDYFVVDRTASRGQGRLQLRVRPNGAKEWMFVYWRKDPESGASRRRMSKIGFYPDVSLAAAREEGQALSRLFQKGVDVQEHLRQERRRQEVEAAEIRRLGTLADLLDAYLGWMQANGKRTAGHVRSSLDRYVGKPFPGLAAAKANEITPADIRDVLARMIDRGVTTHTNRVRSYLHAAFQFGLEAEHDPRKYLGRLVSFGLTFNPVSAVPRQGDFERVGQRLISQHEISSLWRNARATLGPGTGTVPLLCLATAGQRAGELLRLRWDHVDDDKRLLTVPADVSKNGREHLVPIGDLAHELLKGIRPLSEAAGWLFPGRDGKEPMLGASLARAFQRYCVKTEAEPFTPRDLRRAAKTHMGEARISKEIRDRLQNHALSDISSKHYDRYDYLDEKRQAVETWDRYLAAIVAGRKSNVVPLQRG